MKSICPMVIICTKTRFTWVKPFRFLSLKLQLTNLACLELPLTSIQTITNNLKEKISKFTQTSSTLVIVNKFYVDTQLHLHKTYETQLKNVDFPLVIQNRLRKFDKCYSILTRKKFPIPID
jgi:hypothetical protein